MLQQYQKMENIRVGINARGNKWSKIWSCKSPVIIYAIMVIVIAGIAVAIVLIINKNKNKSVVAETENKEEIKQDETNHM